MPWDLFSDDYTPDESTVAATVLRRESRAKARKAVKKLPRHSRPLETWSPMDVVREVQQMFIQQFPLSRANFGDPVKLAIILGARRKRRGWDARYEVSVAKAVMENFNYVQYQGPEVEFWLKFVKSLETKREMVNEFLVRTDPDWIPVKEKDWEPPVYVEPRKPTIGTLEENRAKAASLKPKDPVFVIPTPEEASEAKEKMLLARVAKHSSNGFRGKKKAQDARRALLAFYRSRGESEKAEAVIEDIREGEKVSWG